MSTCFIRAGAIVSRNHIYLTLGLDYSETLVWSEPMSPQKAAAFVRSSEGLYASSTRILTNLNLHVAYQRPPFDAGRLQVAFYLDTGDPGYPVPSWYRGYASVEPQFSLDRVLATRYLTLEGRSSPNGGPVWSCRLDYHDASQIVREVQAQFETPITVQYSYCVDKVYIALCLGASPKPHPIPDWYSLAETDRTIFDRLMEESC